MYRIAADILRNTRIPFEALLPLIDRTAAKVHAIPPADAQTGPARRGDEAVMQHHLQVLRDEGRIPTAGESFTAEEKVAVYRLLSQLLLSHGKKQ